MFKQFKAIHFGFPGILFAISLIMVAWVINQQTGKSKSKVKLLPSPTATALAVTKPTLPPTVEIIPTPTFVPVPTVTLPPVEYPTASPTKEVILEPTNTPQPEIPTPTIILPPTVEPTATQGIGEGFVPTKLTISKLGLKDAPVVSLPRVNGEIADPKSAYEAGFDKDFYKVGQNGAATISAHINYNNVWGIFAKLQNLQDKDEIIVRDNNGNQMVFVVYAVLFPSPQEFNKTRAEIFQSDGPELRLISCGGEFVPMYANGLGEYKARIVVKAKKKT